MNVIGFQQEGVDSVKDVVGFSVVVASVAPSFDDSSVVSVYEEMAMAQRDGVEEVDEEFKSHCFGPADVSLGTAHALPVWVKFPSLPLSADDNADAHARAGI